VTSTSVPQTAFDAWAVRQQLERILANSEFAQSERMCRFLRLAVEYSLEDRACELKEYLIGVEVFDRPSFDPRVDPIVRVEARRLRSKLDKYYEGEGSRDEILIGLPKGGYAAVFGARETRKKQPLKAHTPSTIAVLPFSNLSQGGDSDYLSDGLTQELIHGLTRVQGLRVVAWTSAAQLRGASYDVQGIGQQLSVAAVLTGSVRRAGSRVRIGVQLIDTASNYYLWSEVYDRELDDLLQIQDEISRAIVSALRITLADYFPPPVPPKRPFDFEAHNLYLRGRVEWNKRTDTGLPLSVEYFEQAIARDANFALAWAGLADAYTLLGEYTLLPPYEALPKAKRAALRAVELDPSRGEAWASLALIGTIFEWDWATAEAHYIRAIELNPGYATVHMWFGTDHLAHMGRFDEAYREIELSGQMDPWAPMNIGSQGFLHMLARQYDAALQIYARALELDRNFYKVWTLLGRALIQKGDYDEAVRTLEKGRALGGAIPNVLGALGQAHALAGRPERARALMEELIVLSRQRYVPATCYAMVHLGLGEKDLALQSLEAGCDRREFSMVALAVHPVYDCLRDEPRYRAMVHRMGLDSALEAAGRSWSFPFSALAV
jgi:TolB-like protein/Tfp pilus assembly protein PilF